VRLRSESAYSCRPRRQINVHVGIVSEEERAQHPDLNGIGAFGSRVGYPRARSLPYEDDDLNGEQRMLSVSIVEPTRGEVMREQSRLGGK